MVQRKLTYVESATNSQTVDQLLAVALLIELRCHCVCVGVCEAVHCVLVL